jgi:hypothetical protein
MVRLGTQFRALLDAPDRGISPYIFGKECCNENTKRINTQKSNVQILYQWHVLTPHYVVFSPYFRLYAIPQFLRKKIIPFEHVYRKGVRGFHLYRLSKQHTLLVFQDP